MVGAFRRTMVEKVQGDGMEMEGALWKTMAEEVYNHISVQS